jgi:membrane associated rhomboid family serine protease/Flp pilus assembly protein TadD
MGGAPGLAGSAAVKAPADGSSPSQGSSPARPVVTYILAALTIAIFAAMAFWQHSPSHPDTETLLIRWGANFGPRTMDGQWWRLLTSVFLHLGLVHLAVNMWCLWDLGSFAERIYGHASYLAIYLVAGVAGALCSLAWRPFALEAGASGAIFGIAGALIASFCFGHLPYSRKAAWGALLSVIAFAGYNLFVGLFSVGAGNAAHLGGLLAGFVMGVMLALLSFRLTLVLAVVSLGLTSMLVARGTAYVIPAERGRKALAAGHSDQAIRALLESVQKNPKFAEAYSLLGEAYMKSQQPAAAEGAYRRALDLQPKATGARYDLGMAVLAQHRAADALAIFQELARSDPKNPAAQTGIGTAAEMTGDFQGAFEAFQRAAQLDPRNSQAFINLGSAALQAHHNDEAIAAFSKAVQLQPNNPKALLALAMAYTAVGKQKEAHEAYTRAMDLVQKQSQK